MSVRHLDAMFSPGSVAVIGASDRPGSLGGIVLRNLREGGFAGPVWAVNPAHPQVGGAVAYPDVAHLPAAPDLAVVCTPASTVPGLVHELGERGTRAVVVLSAGLGAARSDGEGTWQEAMLQAARPYLLRVLGPNCLGLLVPGVRLNASFAPAQAQAGSLAFVSQSGALATAMLDWARGRGIGFSHFVSLGDSADVDFGDLLDYLGSDAATRAILLYVESVKHARKFMSAARAAARNKPVIVVKAGRSAAGAKAAASHTGALSGADAVFDAAVRRAGMLRVDTLQALFDAAQTLAQRHGARGPRLAILTNGGGAGVLAADALAGEDGALATLSEATRTALDACLPATWSRANPVDIIGDAPVQRYQQALRILLDAPEVDGVLFMHAPTAIVPAADIAQAVLSMICEAGKPVLTCWLGGPAVAAARQVCEGAGLSSFETPEHAAAAWLQMVHYARNQQILLQLPDIDAAAAAPDRTAARQVLQQAVDDGQEWLEPAQVRTLLQAYGIPTLDSRLARDEDEAAALAASMGGSVALKVVSPQIVHKTDVGGVALNLRGAPAVREAVRHMRASVAAAQPQAQISGFLVQPMATRAQARELIVGISQDPVFGPVVLFGEGGTAVEVRTTHALALPPLNDVLARDLVARSGCAPLLGALRGSPAVHAAALQDTLVKVAQIASDLPLLAELDINPLLADADGVLALDARVRLRKPGAAPALPPAIKPYPAELRSTVHMAGKTLAVRPIRPEDGRHLQDFYAHARPEDLRLRFFMARREVPHSELARYCQIDYDREMTFIALEPEDPAHGTQRMVGEVRAVSDPDNIRAEFAIQIATDWQGKGLGRCLLQRLIGYLRSRGTRELSGQCLADNDGMAALARETGFTLTVKAEEGLVTLHQRLA